MSYQLRGSIYMRVAEVSHGLPRERCFLQAQHIKHQRGTRNENELEKTCIMAGSREELLLLQMDFKLHFQKVNMGVRGHLTVPSTAEIEIFVLLIFLFQSK